MARCFKGRQGGWPKIHRVTKCQQYDGLQQLEVETVETFWVRPYSPSSSCPAGPCWRWGGAKKRQASWAPVWIGVRWLDWRPGSASSPLAHLHRWRISNLGASPPCMAPSREGAELLPRMNPWRRSWTSLNILLQPTKPFSWDSVSRGGVNLILQCYGRMYGWTFHKDITFSPLTKTSYPSELTTLLS